MPELSANITQREGNGPHGDSVDFSKMFDPVRDVKLGYWLIFLFVLVIVFWLAKIPLSSAAIAPGVVSVEGDRREIQHLEGGIIKEILIREGDYVEQDQVLILLSDVEILAQYQATYEQLILSLAREARWAAEYRDQSKIEFGQWLLDRQHEPLVVDAIRSQQDIYQSRIDVFEEQKSGLMHQIARMRERRSGARQRDTILRERLEVITQELTEYEQLKNQGLVTRPQLLELKIRKSDLEEELGDIQAEISEATELKAQYESSVAEIVKVRKQESAENLDQLRDTNTRLRQDFTAIQDELGRTKIRSPLEGYIVNLKASTKGGVVEAGEVIMEIVPDTDKLMIEARVDPKNRNTIHTGQNAEVRFSAFNQRNTLPVPGRVSLISADRMIDPATNTAFYRTMIVLEASDDETISGMQLHPGMHAEVMILTGEKTVFEYLFSPITKSFNRALRED